MSQTSVLSGGQPVGFPGQVQNQVDSEIVSGFSREASAQIPFGYGVQAKPGEERGYFLPTGVSGVVEIHGVVAHGYDYAKAGAVDSAGAQSGNLGASGILPAGPLNIVRRGRVLVAVKDNVQPNDRAYCFVHGTGALTPGLWAASSYGGSYVRDCGTQAVFRSTTRTAADGVTKVAVLEVDFTSKAP